MSFLGQPGAGFRVQGLALRGPRLGLLRVQGSDIIRGGRWNRNLRFGGEWLHWVALGGVPRELKMLKRHLPRVIYHQVH